MAAGAILMFMWYEVFTSQEFEKTYNFLKNIPPNVIMENKEAFDALVNSVSSNSQFNASAIGKGLKLTP
jgi:hypothetical protein